MADLSAYISFLVKFDVTNVNLPVLTLTDNGVYPSGVPATITGIFTITQPDGVTRTGSFSTPDIAWNGSSLPPASIPLRLDTANRIQQGQYTIVHTIAATGYTNTVLTRTFTISYARPTVELEEEFDVYTPSLEYEDVTVYTAGAFTQTITRTWSAIIGTVGSKTGTNSAIFDLAYASNYYDAAYTIYFTSSVLYQSTVYAYLSILDIFSTDVHTDAYAPPTAATLLTYLTTLKTRLDALINSCQRYDIAKADYEYAYILYEHSLARFCAGDTEGVDTYITEILDIYNNNVVVVRVHTNAIITTYSFDCSGGGGTPDIPFVLEEIAGQASAIAAGVVVGASTFTNALLANKYVIVFRGDIRNPGIDPLNGGEYHTKTYLSATITFSTPIQDTEVIYLHTL